MQAFLDALLPACGAFAFRRWAYNFTLAMVAASGRLPQLSGFYHLICTAMQLAEAGGLLGGAQVRSIEDGFDEIHHCHPPSMLQQNCWPAATLQGFLQQLPVQGTLHTSNSSLVGGVFWRLQSQNTETDAAG